MKGTTFTALYSYERYYLHSCLLDDAGEAVLGRPKAAPLVVNVNALDERFAVHPVLDGDFQHGAIVLDTA